jgi:Tfp pilus assembly protein PilX
VERNRGVALILALLALTFLTVLSGALLTTSTIDIWISDNYKAATQSLYLAEAGIEDARELLRASGRTATELLTAASGPDRQLLTADDQPLIPSRELVDSSGRGGGFYEVTLRNDAADKTDSLTDTNEALALVSVGRIGATQKTVEVTVRKGGFPETSTDPRLSSVAGIENLVASITKNATDVYTGSAMGDFGGPANYRVVVVDGNLNLGPGVGYGLLLVRGDLDVIGDTVWNGLVLVIGHGVLRWNPGVSGSVDGGLFIAQTLADDGSLLATPAGVTFDITNPAQIKAANRPFPYNAIAIRER